MKTITFLMLSSLAVGCSDEADIGVDSIPMTCPTDGTRVAEISGTVKDPNNGTVYDFDSVSEIAVTAPTTGGPTLTLRGSELLLRFGFYCGATQRDRYGVKPDTQQGLDCPLEVAGTVLGQIEILNAKSGTFIVDENSNCFAGRFRVDFGSNGSLDGSFTTPWQ